MIVKIDKIWRPKSDVTGVAWIQAEGWIPEYLVKTCNELGVPLKNVLHAGGNIGLYARAFAKHFENVYTFEPEAENFRCLNLNCAKFTNIFAFRAALGNTNTPISLANRDTDNCGTWQIAEQGDIPTIKIDNLNVELNLIHLDVEGFELFALKGGINTIRKYRPLIAFENMEHSKCYGYSRIDIDTFLKSLGYNMSAEYANEIMYYYTMEKR